jgi:hypothetical protein
MSKVHYVSIPTLLLKQGGSSLLKIQTKLFAFFCMSLDRLLLYKEIYKLIFHPSVYEHDHIFIYLKSSKVIFHINVFCA